MGRACRYCKSPAVKKPCFYYLDNPRDGGDPPCELDPDYDDYDEPRGAKRGWSGFVIAALAIFVIAAFVAWLA